MEFGAINCGSPPFGQRVSNTTKPARSFGCAVSLSDKVKVNVFGFLFAFAISRPTHSVIIIRLIAERQARN